MNHRDNYYWPLAESIFKEAGKAPEIPRCFFEVGSMRQAWEAVFESREQLERTADKLRKLRINTAITRKDFKHGSPELVLACALGQHDLHRQLHGQLPAEQIKALVLHRLVGRYLAELIGQDRLDAYEKLIKTKCAATIQAEIIKRFPFASEVFSYGWGTDHTYTSLLCIPDLLAIIEKEQGKRFYQATLAAHVFLGDFLGARLPDWLIEGGYRVAASQLAGLMQHWARIVRGRGDQGLPTLPSVATLAAGMAHAAFHLNQGDGLAPLEIMSTLHAMFTEHSTSFTFMVTEHVNLALIPELVRHSKRIEDMKAKLGIASLGSDCRPISSRKASFPKPEDGVMSTQRVRVLAQLWRDFDHATAISQITKQIEDADNLIREYTKQRDRLSDATKKVDLDVDLIENLAKEARETKGLAEACLQLAARELAEVDEQIRTVEAAWREQISGGKKKLGEQQLREQLINTQGVAQELRRERDDLRRELARQKDKTRAQEGIAKQPEKGDRIDVALIRKVAQSPDQLTPAEILRYIESICGERLRILPSAWRSADEAEQFESPKRLLTLLDRLMFDYAPAILGGQPDSEARNVFGGCFAAKESDTVENRAAMRAERTFLVDGEEVFFERHLKIGNSPSIARGMRIYFELIDSRVVIAHCGAHLTTDSTC